MDDDLFFDEAAALNKNSETHNDDNQVSMDDAPVLTELDDTNTTSKKKRTINRGPKLDARRLLGARGLPALQNHFESVTFKGKGHEAEDLDLMMSKLEHWAHRLFPKFMFDDCLEKIEALGHKKEIQTCMKRIRMGMPVMDDNMQSTIITEDGPTPIDSEIPVLDFNEETNMFPDPVPNIKDSD
uniref:TIMELESS-interacting protein n=1 Tax=Phallusia mammillata TaxID=59560 RepID=A0A6F9DVD6_9ASCI|nr:TIMELESS-interacting protein-like [Phallusia mammillata]